MGDVGREDGRPSIRVGLIAGGGVCHWRGPDLDGDCRGVGVCGRARTGEEAVGDLGAPVEHGEEGAGDSGRRKGEERGEPNERGEGL